MATKFPTILPSDPQAKIHYNQFRKKLIGANIYLNDPEYLKLMRQYIVSLETYVRNIKEACALFGKAHLPGPRRQIDFYKLETARRFYERDAYRYFSYRPGIKSPLPPPTRRRMARQYMKDAHTAMSFGNVERANDKLTKAQKEVAALLDEVWKRYKASSDQERNAMKGELLEALQIAQYVLGDNHIPFEISEEVGKII